MFPSFVLGHVFFAEGFVTVFTFYV
jgi:hypothetical protein